MYLTLYGLKALPFRLSPDARFFYPSPTHAAASAAATTVCGPARGVAVVTGDVGTGKTTLIERLLQDADPTVRYVRLNGTPGSPTEFLQSLLLQLDESPFHLADDALRDAAILAIARRSRAGGRLWIIIDDAHECAVDIWRELQHVLGATSLDDMTVGVVAAGRPELDDTLDAPSLAALQTLVVARARLEPLRVAECRPYLAHRLRVAGNDGRLVFDDGSLDLLYRYTGGVPRLINTLADTALTLAHEGHRDLITAADVRTAVASLQWVEYARRRPHRAGSAGSLPPIAPPEDSTPPDEPATNRAAHPAATRTSPVEDGIGEAEPEAVSSDPVPQRPPTTSTAVLDPTRTPDPPRPTIEDTGVAVNVHAAAAPADDVETPDEGATQTGAPSIDARVDGDSSSMIDVGSHAEGDAPLVDIGAAGEPGGVDDGVPAPVFEIDGGPIEAPAIVAALPIEPPGDALPTVDLCLTPRITASAGSPVPYAPDDDGADWIVLEADTGHGWGMPEEPLGVSLREPSSAATVDPAIDASLDALVAAHFASLPRASDLRPIEPEADAEMLDLVLDANASDGWAGTDVLMIDIGTAPLDPRPTLLGASGPVPPQSTTPGADEIDPFDGLVRAHLATLIERGGEFLDLAAQPAAAPRDALDDTARHDRTAGPDRHDVDATRVDDPAPPEPSPAAAAIVGWLHVQLEGATIRSLGVVDGQTLIIGRTTDNDIVLDSPFVSRHHARLTVMGSLLRLEDLDSRNGVRLFDERIRDVVMEFGDVASIGRHDIRFDRV